MDELSDFLRACLDDDERVITRNLGDSGLGDDGSFPDYRTYTDADTEAADDYLSRFPPSRMMAEVEARRRILDDHEPLTNGACDRCSRGMYSNDHQLWPCTTVRLLAQPYADRPGWREEWACPA